MAASSQMLEAHRLRNPQIGRFNIFSGDKKGFVLHPDNLSRVRSGMPGTAVAEAWRRTFTHSAAPRIIQSILRRAAVETTTRHYVIIDESQNAAAMAELAEVITRKMETGTSCEL
jgi:hypothetical protein